MPPRTSITDPLKIDAMPCGNGVIGMTLCPGKHASSAFGTAWARDLALDLDAVVDWGATSLVSLVERSELSALGVSNLGDAAEEAGLEWHHLPIEDLRVPGERFERRWVYSGNVLRRKLRSGERIKASNGVFLNAIFTPGHDEAHVCYYMARDRVMFTGDTVLGGSSTTVQDLADYMNSLEKLSRYRVEVVCPGHGPVASGPRGARLIPWYIGHRNEREQQVIGALQKGIEDVADMVRDIYPKNLNRGLRQAAGRNVQAHLAKLVKEGRVEVEARPAVYRLKPE